MHFVASVNEPFTRPNLNRACKEFIDMKYMFIFLRVLNFFDGVLCKSSIYKCNEVIDKNTYVTFIKDYVLLEYI